MIKTILSFLKALNSGTKPEELALASVLAMFAGFTFVPFNFLVFLSIILILKANTSMFFLMLIFFKAVSLVIDPLGDITGYAVLTLPALQPLFEKLSALPAAPFTNFNNTLVMGGFVIAVILSIPVWLAVRSFISYYRKNLQSKIEKAKIVKALNIGGIINTLIGGDRK